VTIFAETTLILSIPRYNLINLTRKKKTYQSDMIPLFFLAGLPGLWFPARPISEGPVISRSRGERVRACVTSGHGRRRPPPLPSPRPSPPEEACRSRRRIDTVRLSIYFLSLRRARFLFNFRAPSPRLWHSPTLQNWIALCWWAACALRRRRSLGAPGFYSVLSSVLPPPESSKPEVRACCLTSFRCCCQQLVPNVAG